MASNYTFQLRRDRTNKKGECPICVNKREGTKALLKSTGISIHPKYWDQVKQKIKSNHPRSIELNLILNKFRGKLDDIATNVRLTTDQTTVTISDLKKGLTQAKVKKLSFFEYYKQNVSDLSRTLSATRIKSYNTTLGVLERYVKHTGHQIDFDDIDTEFYYSFTDFMRDVLQFKPNTVGSRIKDIKATMNNAVETGNTTNTAYKSKRFVTTVEDVDNVYLSSEELQAMYELVLTNDLKLDRARDLFLVGCYTGLRFGDFTNIRKEYIQGDYIDFKRTSKTGQQVVVKIAPILKEIMEKYNGITENSLPPKMVNQRLNKYIKEVAELAGINEAVSIESTKGKLTVIQDYPKYELITTHTARRSFATNAFLDDVQPITIMAITGHKTEASFMKYIKVSSKTHADILRRTIDQKHERASMKAV